MNADNNIYLNFSSEISFLFNKEFFPDRIIARLFLETMDLKWASSKWTNNEVPLSPLAIRVEIFNDRKWYFEC